MNKFDYSVLATPPTFREARKEVPVIPSHYKNVIYVFAIIAIMMSIYVVGISAYNIPHVIPILFSGYALFAFYNFWCYRKEIIDIASVQRFAKANDMTSFYNAKLDIPYPGSLFNEGHTQYITMAARTKEESDTIEVGNYRYVTGHGRSARTHNYTYALMKLDKRVPHIFIDSKSNNSWLQRNHAKDYASSQQLKFEGDFNDHFTVLVPDDYGRDATYILTPDILQALIQYGKDYDFELMDNTLVMFKHGQANLSDAKTLETILAKATQFAGEFRKQTRFYADERVAAGRVGTVAEGGQKLKTAFPWLLVGIAVYFVVSWLVRIFA